ncbi:KpsF/GutQ family sugar-phosphate isomerase [Novosphingobium acidiphilum]|uniref:KpsF/GutQ family sugar-phosphate isomerase n=1 Tax=Novosphingobium acidiphilum TaxID=505248 RepID=UPI001FDEFDC1|nr:KpsF/GutQ family sugar-phosphate isomerase [Novosphingobium acidiphilum]
MTELAGLNELAENLDLSFVAACEAIAGLQRQLVVTGMGKSGHIARKIAATFAATGTPAIYVHPSEAGHGDLGMMTTGDVLLVLSNSGNTRELLPMMHYAQALKITVLGMASRRKSPVMELSDIGLLLPRVKEACSVNVAPTTSTTVQLALGDALAMTVMDIRGISTRHLRALHPAGTIGLSLAPVHEIMHRSENLPLVGGMTKLTDAIATMTSGGFGLAGVSQDDGQLIGIITDGDLRRLTPTQPSMLAREAMTQNPKVIGANWPASDALIFLNQNNITAAFVVEKTGIAPQKPVGIIHIHDLLRHGLT